MEETANVKRYSLDKVVDTAIKTFKLKDEPENYRAQIRRVVQKLGGEKNFRSRKKDATSSNKYIKYIFTEDDMTVIFREMKNYLIRHSTDGGNAVYEYFGDLDAEEEERLDRETQYCADETRQNESGNAEDGKDGIPYGMLGRQAEVREMKAKLDSLFRLFFTEFDHELLMKDLTLDWIRQPLDVGYKGIDERLKQPEGSYYVRDNKFARFIATTARDAVNEKLNLIAKDVAYIEENMERIMKKLEVPIAKKERDFEE